MYDYNKEKEHLFTDEGQRDFLKVRDNVQRLLKQAGCVMMANAISVVTGIVWSHMACVDRLVELGELKEITDDSVMAQNRVFISG